jgi:hypothetical protein
MLVSRLKMQSDNFQYVQLIGIPDQFREKSNVGFFSNRYLVLVVMPDALSDQISLFFRQAGKNSRAVDNLEAEKGMIHSRAVIEGAKAPQLLESAHIVKEGQRLRKGHILFLHAQRSGDYCDVLADSVGMRKLENYFFSISASGQWKRLV